MVAVARALGVSPSTVSNAYNRPDQLSPALRDRVLQTAAGLGYAGPDPVARNLRKGRAGAVGLVFHDRLALAFDDPAAVQFLQGFTEITDNAGLAVVLVPDLPDSQGVAVRDAAVDGFVLYGLAVNDPLVPATVARRLPTVVVDAPLLDGVDFVGIDDAAAAELAVAHLVARGHRDIGVLSFPLPIDDSDSVAGRRVAGCRRVLEDVAVEECSGSTIEAGRAGTEALLARVDCTAVFAFSDRLALGARQAAPQVEVVGFDATAPGLTSVHQPLRDKGRAAGEHLLDALRGDRTPRRTLLPVRLVIADG